MTKLPRTKLSCLVMASALALPVPAFADCATRISAVENHPAITEEAGSGAAATMDQSEPADVAADQEEEIVKEEVVGEGTAVHEGGGETVYQEGGPATPRENWFGSPPDKAAVLTHLETAKEAQGTGDEKACLESIEKAEKAMSPDAG